MESKVKNQINLEHLHSMIVQRIYHEDILLVQRTYTLLTAHAFLVVAFVTSLQSQKPQLNIAYLLASLAMLIALFQMAWGFRTHRMILFWRQYLKSIESECQFPLDSKAWEFFENNKTDVPTAIIEGSGRTMNSIFPWRYIKSTNVMMGVGFPLLLTFFWACALLVIPYDLTVPIIIVVVFMIAFFVIEKTIGWRSAIPYYTSKDQK
jgi:hypothetical protein